MYKLIVLACAVCCFAACNSENQQTSAETTQNDSANKKTDALFDGKSTAGWHKYGGAQAGAAWKVDGDVLYLDTSVKGGWQIANGGDLVTDEEFENFDLKLDWKIAPKGNSGIIFYIHEDTTTFKHSFESGPEMQIVDNDGHPDGKLVRHMAGDLYDLIACSKKTVKPVGEWNQVEIKSLNGQLDFYLNGENVVSTMMWDDNWNKMIAGSKFKSMPGFGTFKKGKIALQDHGAMVSFRNIQIKKL